VAQTTKAYKTQEALAKAANEAYYNKCLAELKKDLDAQLKHKMAMYQAEKHVNQQVIPKATIINIPEERTQANPPPPDSIPSMNLSLMTLLSCLLD
jgi:hypothetical protein